MLATLIVATFIGVGNAIRMIEISYGARDTLLSDRKMYPNFFRTVPDDEMQYVAIAKLLERLKWNWVGILTSDDEYGEREIRHLSKHFSDHGICIEFKILVSVKNYNKIPPELRSSTTEVLIICGSLSRYVKEVQYKDPNGKVMIFNDKGELPSTMEIVNWITRIKDTNITDWIIVGDFDGSLSEGQQLTLEPERISWKGNKFCCCNLSNERILLVLLDVYFCLLDQNIFCEARLPYTIISVLLLLNRSYNSILSQVPRGQCSEECLPGFRKSVREGYHPCCYNCAPCSEGEISNQSDSELCKKCPENEWPNEAKTICSDKVNEYLSYEEDILVLFFSITSVIFATTSLLIFGLFVWFQSTPIVRANNRNLSFILLLSLILSFLSVFLFLGRPVDITCMLQQVTFGVPFTISASSILAKTIMVFIAFKATRPGSSCRKWVGVKLPNTVMLFCSSIQVMNCILWLSISPPFQEYDMDSYPGKIIIQCNEGSVIGFYSMLGYMGFLAAVSFLLAFMVRTLPDSFNEAKYITFSMLVFCSVWIAMIPAYLSTSGKYMVAVEIFAILTSSAGILLCMFSPKLYILLFKPELNTRGTMLGKRMMEM
ncbi:vomeronasal type-2 receptor 1-like [Rana temporaria]|uniref:vomeronasal type-2 receptor 1-like n=1 Tax=Rana temporaria TaxID=8407 RepID=UPI001AAE0D1A|nr:vomeronasal type-2 receptor 1-like [Rana temporaria]